MSSFKRTDGKPKKGSALEIPNVLFQNIGQFKRFLMGMGIVPQILLKTPAGEFLINFLMGKMIAD